MTKETEIKEAVEESISKLINHPSFQKYLAERLAKKPMKKDDILIFNNSFVYREEVKTNMSDLHVVLKFTDNKKLGNKLYIVKSKTNNVKEGFSLFNTRENNKANLVDIKNAVKEQTQSLGDLLFILIGQIDDSLVIEVPLQTLQQGNFRKLIWDPALQTPTLVSKDTITVQDTYDEELIWSEVKRQLPATSNEDFEKLRGNLGAGLDKLQDLAVARLILPTSAEKNQNCMTSLTIEVLKKQRDEYAQALNKFMRSKTSSDSAINDILRIAYNFSSDAIAFLRLIISIGVGA